MHAPDAFADAWRAQDWVFSGWDEGRSWEEAGCALPLPKGHRVCRTNWNSAATAPRSAVANKLMAKLYNCPLREASQQLPNVLASLSVYDFDDNRGDKDNVGGPRETFQIDGYVSYKYVQPIKDMSGRVYDSPLIPDGYHPTLKASRARCRPSTFSAATR